MRFCTKLAVGCSVLAMPALAHADVVWPALYLETRLFSWWAISIGLIAEVIFVKWLFAIPMKKAAIVTTVANVASSVSGILLIPLAGIVWEIVSGFLYMKALNWGTFNPITWAATFVLACLVNTAIESLVYHRGYKFSIKRHEFGWIFIANAVSVAVALGSLFVFPIQP